MPVNPATIRLMRPADATAVVRMIHALAKDQGSKATIKPAQLLANYKRAGHMVLVAAIGSKLVGYLVSSTRFNFEYAADEWKMDYLFVDTLYRDRGIGRDLIAAWARRAHKAKVGALRTAAQKTNKGADRLYRNMGLARSSATSHRYAAYGAAVKKVAGE